MWEHPDLCRDSACLWWGGSLPVSLWNSQGKFRKNDKVFKDQVYEGSIKQPKGSDFEKQSGFLCNF